MGLQLVADVSCSHCKRIVVQAVHILHPSHQDPDQRQECEWGDDMRESFAFVATSPSNLPDWIQRIMESSGWTKGKLYCPRCQSHVGSFNFTNEMKCLHCRQTFGSSLYFLCGNVSIVYCENNNQLPHHSSTGSSSSNRRSSSLPVPMSKLLQYSSTRPPPSYVNANVSPLHDPFHPESPSISTLDLVTSDVETFDQNYDRICGELSLMRDPLHPDNLRISDDPYQPEVHLRAVRSSPNSLVSLGTDPFYDDNEMEVLIFSEYDLSQLSPELSSIRSCFPNSSQSSIHQRRHSLSSTNAEDSPRFSLSSDPPPNRVTTSLFVSTHESSMSSLTRRHHGGTRDLSSNSPASQRRPLEHPRMGGRANNEIPLTQETSSAFASTAVADNSSSSEEDIYCSDLAREYQCPICLEVMYYPVSCKPCHHKFCGICLRIQARESVATTTKCAVCRSYIHHVVVLDELAAKLKECFSAAYKRRHKQISVSNNSVNAIGSAAAPSINPNLDALPYPGFHAGKNSYQICCCIAYIHASKHRKKYMAILQALLYFVVIGLPIFTLIIATVFSQ